MSRRKYAEISTDEPSPEELDAEKSKEIVLEIDPKLITCQHVEQYKHQLISSSGSSEKKRLLSGKEIYTRLFRWFVYPNTPASRFKKSHCYGCFYSECRDKLLPRLHVCMYCTWFTCHKHKHTHAAEKNHFLAMDASYGNVYCFKCNDYIFDHDFSIIAKNIKRYVMTKPNNRVYDEWTPNVIENVLLTRFSTPHTVLNNKDKAGLRGLINLGSTCFMNCILQTLIHTPSLRDHFLGGDHRCHFVDSRKCLGCSMNKLMQEFYSNTKTPFIPIELLHLVWTHAKHLAGYEQQDAHEFFISTLDIMHRHSSGVNTISSNKQCICIIDKIFNGSLQSDVVCIQCGGVSSVVDPIWDFSLDLVNTHIENGKSAKEQQPLSLYDCLELFTRTEHLGSSAKIKCSNCQTYQESTKQLSFKKLPIVASFHLKRFEQTNRFNKKISTYISFPLFLNMTDFTSSRKGYKEKNAMETDSNNDESFMCEEDNGYFLFAVVNHSGTLETGHYTVYVRQRPDQWYKCDDHFVFQATEQEVLQSEGYLLFYHKRTLQYKDE